MKKPNKKRNDLKVQIFDKNAKMFEKRNYNKNYLFIVTKAIFLKNVNKLFFYCILKK